MYEAVAEVWILDGWEEYCRFQIAELRRTWNFPRRQDWRLADGAPVVSSTPLPDDRITFEFCGIDERPTGHVALYRYTPRKEDQDGS